MTISDSEKFTAIRQAGNKPDDTLSSTIVNRFIYADKARVNSKNPLMFNLNLNKMRYEIVFAS